MRNLGLIVALWLATLLPTNSLALGLGEIEVKSFLNQPLNAEIEVISARPGEIDDLLVSLASRDAFTRAGLSRPRHLSDLRFAVRKNEAGDEAVILVTTKSAVKEPFLNFLIEADWSKGRVLREFTVLLDPPFYADQPAPAELVSEPVGEPAMQEEQTVSAIAEDAGLTTTQTDETMQEPVEQVTEPIALAETPPPESEIEELIPETSQNIIQGDVLVVKGDTLWSIASRYKDADHSMSQVMLAFLRANPDAFNDSNINNMKLGAVLRVPDALELDMLDQREAYAEVLKQNGLWNDYVARVTGVSPAVAVEADASGEIASDAGEASGGELSLLLPGDAETDSTGSGDSAEIDALRTKLALAEEELDAARIENTELESRISELQARLSKLEELQKMVEIEDDSLATLQGQQAEQPEPVAAVEADQTPDGESEDTLVEESLSDAIKEDEEALLEELLAEEAAAQAEEQAALQPADIPDGESEDALRDEPEPADAGGATMTSEPADSEVTAPPAPVIITEPVTRSPSIFDGILPPSVIDMIPSMPSLGGLFADPIILAAIGGVVVLLLLLMLVKRRKAAAEDDSTITASAEEDMFAADDDEELTPIHLAEAEEPAETDIKVPSEEDVAEPPAAQAEPMDDLAATAVISATDMPEPEAAPAAPSAEQDDVLNEVDVYLAYGLYDNAEDLLKSNIEEHPERADYRSKLLDTYFATKKVDAFVAEAENLKSMGEAGAGYWDRVQVMGYELAPDNALFSDAKDIGLSAADLEIAKPQEADFDLGAGDDDDTNFSTTDFQLGEEDTDGDFSDTASFGEAGEIAATQQIPQLDELPEIDEEDDTNVRGEAAAEKADTGLDLPDEIGDELEFSMDDEAGAAEGELLDLELPDDQEVAAESDADETTLDDDGSLDFTSELDAAMEETGELDLDTEMALLEEEAEDELTDEDAVEINALADEATAIITPNYEDTELVSQVAGGEAAEADDESSIDLGMDDTAMGQGPADDETGEISLDTGEISLDTGELSLEDEEDDEEDISIIDFGGDDFVEPTDIVETIEDEDDSVAMDIDVEDAEDVKTGTFAPGDFDEPTAAAESISDIDDIGDLMLPDDVDEVSTKLDLARAFIDMGDTEGARGSLEEVLSEGNEEQKAEAKSLLENI